MKENNFENRLIQAGKSENQQIRQRPVDFNQKRTGKVEKAC